MMTYYCFSLQSVIYLHNLIRPVITSIAQMFIYLSLMNQLNGIKVSVKKHHYVGVKLHI